MTTVETDQPEPSARAQRARRRDKLGDHVARTVSGLQERLLRDTPQPEAVSALARLRRGIGRDPGFDYTLERYLQVPEHLLGYLPADDSKAAHAEYARARRGDPVRPAPAVPPGANARRRARTRLGIGPSGTRVHRPDGVRRRFAALGTASTYHESIYHLRSLITMLREHQIPLDYGLLADDLRTLRRPDGHARMQATWGREFFRSRPGTDDSATDTPEEPAS